MTEPPLLSRVQDALTAIGDAPLTFTAVAAHAGISRTSLYRNPELRALVEEHRARGRDAHTLTGLTTDITHLRSSLEAVADRVRQQEERLRRLERRGPQT